MKIPKENTPQYRFAEIIRQSDDSSLLNYGFLDGGFYNAAGILPIKPFFCRFSINLPEMYAEQDQIVKEGLTAFVVTRNKKLPKGTSYQLVDESSMIFEGKNKHYYLYQRSDLIDSK